MKKLSSHELANKLLSLPDGECKIITEPFATRGLVEGDIFIVEPKEEEMLDVENGETKSRQRVLGNLNITYGEVYI